MLSAVWCVCVCVDDDDDNLIFITKNNNKEQ